MKRKMIILLITAGIVLPGITGAVTEEDFVADTTKKLINLCIACSNDPLYH